MKREISNAGYDLVIENDRSVEEINRREFTLLRRRTLASWLFAILTMCFSMGWISLGMEQNMISDGVASAHHRVPSPIRLSAPGTPPTCSTAQTVLCFRLEATPCIIRQTWIRS